MTIEEEGIVSHPFSLTSADKTICVAAAAYAAIALAWRHVPLEVLVFLAVYFPLSRIRLRWLKPPVEAFYIAFIVGAIVRGGMPQANIMGLAMQFVVLRIMMDMPHKRPKEPSRLSRAGSRLLRVLVLALGVCTIGFVVFAALRML